MPLKGVRKKLVLHRNPLSIFKTIIEACQSSMLQQMTSYNLWYKGLTQDFARTALLLWLHS